MTHQRFGVIWGLCLGLCGLAACAVSGTGGTTLPIDGGNTGEGGTGGGGGMGGSSVGRGGGSADAQGQGGKAMGGTAGGAGQGGGGGQATTKSDAAADSGKSPDAAPAADGGTGGSSGNVVSMVKACTGKTISATPATANTLLSQNRGGNIVMNLSPGMYDFSLGGFACVEVRCTEPAIVNGAPNKNGCVTSSTINVTSSKNVIIENIVFLNDVKTDDDYGVAVYKGTDAIRIAHNAFNGNMNHDISTKNEVGYAEVLNNLFVSCMRHCVEIGQNGNVPSRPSTCGTMIIRGNTFSSRINAITQRYNRKLIVDGNEFINVSSDIVQNWPYWEYYDYGQPGGAEANLVPTPPLLTEVTNNKFTGTARLQFEGRGVFDDTVVVKGNTGSKAACKRMAMRASIADAHSNEETVDPPKLDPASDIACPVQ